MTRALSASPFNKLLTSCTLVFSAAIDILPCLFAVVALLLICASAVSAQQIGPSSPTVPLHSRSEDSSAKHPKAQTAPPQPVPTRTINFNVFSTAFAGSYTFYGFSMDPVTGYYYARSGYGPVYGGSGSVNVYPGPAALAANTPSSTVALTNGGFYGTYFAVQNGVIFGRTDSTTSAISSWNAVTGAAISSSSIPNMCGTNGNCTFDWGGFSGVNWMQDSNGLYVLGTDDSNGWQVNQMNTDLSVANTQYIYPTNNELGYGIVIKGHLLTAAQFDTTTIDDDFNILTGIDQPVSYTLAGIPSSGYFGYYFSNALYDPTIDRLYIWNTDDGILYSADNVSAQFGINQVLNFGSVNVGTAAGVQTLTYYFDNSTTLSAINILTQGANGLDYTDGGSSTCTVGAAYSAGQSCVISVAFTPSASGLRSGSVAMFAQGSNLPLMTAYLNGVGQSGAVTIDPGTQTTIATLSNGGQGGSSAIDGSGDVYVVDHFNSQVFEVAAGNFAQSSVVSSGLSSPTAVALDGGGNLYISDTGNGRVVMVPNENGTLNSGDMSTVNISGLGSPTGLTVDGSGNLYVADNTNGNVIKVGVGGGTLVVASGLTSPTGVALDDNGNLYVAANNAVTEYPAGGSAPIPMGSGYANPSDVAVDASGALYVADAGNARIVMVAPGGASQANLTITGIKNPQGVTVDDAGNLYVTDSGNIIKMNRTQAAALVFGGTNIGSASASQAVTVSNAGNQQLTVSNLAITPNFTQVASGGTDCSSSTQLSSSQQCLIALEFAPTTSGTLPGTVTLTDNALNNAASAQTVQLSGIGTQIAQTITFGALSNEPFGSAPFAVSASASSGLIVSFASTTPSVCTVTATTVSLVAMGTCTIQATQPGNATYAAAIPVNQSFLVTDFVLSSSPTSTTIAAGQTATITLTVTPEGPFTSPINFSCSGLPALANCSFSPATVTPGGSTVTTTLTISTAAHTAALLPLGRRSSPLYAIWLVLPAILLGMVGIVTPKHRKLSSYCLLVLLMGGCLLQGACAGTSEGGSKGGTGGTPSGSYTITVTGAAASTQNTATVMLTVQ